KTASATVTVSGDGSHLIACTATDAAANTGASSGSANSFTVKIDTQRPVVKVTAPSATTLSTSIPVKWTGTDNFSGVKTYDVRVRSAPWNGTFGAWTALRTATTAKSLTYSASAGKTYCFGVRATDKAGNTSAYPTTGTCTVVPLT